tara:strand:- start:2386 stop:3807 length:1422 start_codon:yes stop_codon:yes gene_type:complete
MFKAIGNFFKNFLTKEEVRPEQIDVIFESVDTDRAVKTLNIKENGKDDGKNEIPNSDETSLGSTELKIYQFIATETSQRKQQANGNMLSYDKAILDLNIKDKFEEAKNLGAHTKHKIESIVQEDKNGLVDSKDKFQELERDYKKFKIDNKITYVPDIKLTLILPAGILVGILLMESILNGVFFAKASALGLLGGIMYACLVAFVNVSISWGLGRSICNKNHIKKRLKTLGSMAIVAVVAWLTVYNLFVAHYRQQLDVDIKNAGTLAAKAFFQSPFALNDFEPWILFFVGIVFGLAACVDGYFWDDPYPGYGKLCKRMEQAKEDWDAEQKETVTRLEELQIEQLGQFTETQSTVKADVNLLNEIIGQKQTLVTNLENNIEQIESICEILIKMYREINTVHRQTDPPRYFKEEVTPPVHETVDTNMENDYARLKEQEKLRDECIAMVEQIKNTIVDLYNRGIQGISDIDLASNNK